MIDVLEVMKLMLVDIFLIGIEVGEVNGLEVCWLLKGNFDIELIYIIVVIVLGEECWFEESLDVGVDDFICKLVNMIELWV